MATSKWATGAVVVVLGAAIGAVAGSQRQPEARHPAVVTPAVGNWQLGPYVTDVTTTIGSAGGEIVVTTGDLAGLRMEFPADAAADGTSVTVEHAPIIGHTWGSIVDPATPAIRVTVGDGSYLQDAATVSVPITLAEGEMAMGLYVNEGGALEGMPVLGPADDGSLGVVTRHFSEWFVSRFAPSELPAEIFTGYQMARDNWSFVNYGSYVSPGGHCAGMSISSMWFFLERTQGGVPSLYMLYDYPDGAPTPRYQHDDAHGLRLASMVQRDIRWGSEGVEFYRKARYAAIDPWQYEAFRYAMYLTGEPQYATLGAASGTGGHAVVAYGVTAGTVRAGEGITHNGGEVWIADPNRPFILNSLVYDAVVGRFQSYVSGLRADGSPLAFPYIGYAAKTALVDWNLVGQRFAEADAGTIGHGVFPDVVLFQWVVDATAGVGAWVGTTSPVVDASGTATFIVSLATGSNGAQVVARVMAADGTDALQFSDIDIGTTVHRKVVLAAGTYKIAVWAAKGDGLKWVDAFPVTVQAAPVPTTTTTLPVSPTAVPTSTLVPTTVPSTAPPVTYDCSACPDGIEGINCRLHCEQI